MLKTLTINVVVSIGLLNMRELIKSKIINFPSEQPNILNN